MELDKIYNEDCLEGMKRIPDGMVDCIITDPPYELENQGGGFWSKNEDPAANAAIEREQGEDFFCLEADKEKAKAWCMKAVKNEKGGDEVLEELRKDAAKGDEDAKTILLMVGKRP